VKDTRGSLWLRWEFPSAYVSVLTNKDHMIAKQLTTARTTGLIRLPEVLQLYPVSRSAWYQGIKRGIHPAPLKLAGGRTAAWRVSDVLALIEASQTA